MKTLTVGELIEQLQAGYSLNDVVYVNDKRDIIEIWSAKSKRGTGAREYLGEIKATSE